VSQDSRPRNRVSCDPVWERGDKGFGERSAEGFFITDAHEDDVFPNEDFFPDINNLFGDMSLTDDNTNDSSASASAPTPYVFLIFTFVLQFLGLAINLDMLDMFCSYRSCVNMVSLFSMFLPILCLLFSWIKYHGKLLISPTESDRVNRSAIYKNNFLDIKK
jgi:hypothetical protein